MVAQEGSTQLFLVVETGDAAADRLAAALAAAPAASVLIAPPAGHALEPAAAQGLVTCAQSRGAAALLLDNAALARRLGADGVHLPAGSEIEARYRDARQTVGPAAAVGVDAGTSRHDAMTLAEAGADYVAFGLPEGVDPEAAHERRLELIEWWAEIFEIPCVALDVETPEDAALLARVGADFIGIRLAAGEPMSDVGDRLRAMAEAVAAATAG